MPSLLSNLKSAREWATPALRSSAFLSRGVLTPEEFVAAGDELVFRCPTWTWESGDPSRRKRHLPADKQFLKTRGVPCATRADDVENVVTASEGVGGGDGNGDDDGGDNYLDDDGEWLVSQVLTAEERRRRDERALEDEFDILDGEGEVVAAKDDGGGGGDRVEEVGKKVAQLSLGGEEAAVATTADDEYADMADFEDDGVLEDEAAASVVPSSSASAAAPSATGRANAHVLLTRSYDVSITYDKYYQTPRVWLSGYDDSGALLTGNEMMRDVISDYAHRTVTVENHPHVSGPHASVHPCQHGAVMKTIVRNLTKEGGEEPTVEAYLFIFLKFVSSMIPTISYDFTMDVSASTKK